MSALLSGGSLVDDCNEAGWNATACVFAAIETLSKLHSTRGEPSLDALADRLGESLRLTFASHTYQQNKGTWLSTQSISSLLPRLLYSTEKAITTARLAACEHLEPLPAARRVPGMHALKAAVKMAACTDFSAKLSLVFLCYTRRRDFLGHSITPLCKS